MIVMNSNVGFEAGRLFGMFEGRIAHLHGPTHAKNLRPGVPWALDNGVFSAWSSGKPWDEFPFYEFLSRVRRTYHTPNALWVAVPDWVADRERTIQLWKEHAPRIAAQDFRLAFVVQDGMTEADVPTEAEIVFVGGSTTWKWRNLKRWTENFARVHVGRVNSYRLLWMAHNAGAESCDGTGWFRGSHARFADLVKYLRESSAGAHPQLELVA